MGDEEEEVLYAPPFDGTFARLASHGNGSCFFNSIAACLNWRGYRDMCHAPSVQTGRELRARVVTEQHWARYGAAVGLDDFGGETELDTFAQACNPRRPADNLTFALASFVLQLRLLVLVSPQEMYDTAELVREDAPVALIAWLDRVHFEPIVSRVARPLPPCAAAVARSLRALADAGAEETGPEVDAAVEPSARGAVGLLNPADPIVGALLELRRAK